MSSDEGSWDAATTKRIGEQIRRIRDLRKLSAQEVSDRTDRLKHRVGRATISELETGRRKAIPVTDLLVLAEALGVPPIYLLFPEIPDGEVEAIPGWSVSSSEAMQWFYGDRPLVRSTEEDGDVVIESSHIDYRSRELLDAVKRYQDLERALVGVVAGSSRPDDPEGRIATRKIIREFESELERSRRRIRDLGGIVHSEGPLNGDD